MIAALVLLILLLYVRLRLNIIVEENVRVILRMVDVV